MIIAALGIFLISFFLFTLFLKQVKLEDRFILVSFAFLLYIVLIVAEQFYLEKVYGLHFNVSDPEVYYLKTKGISLAELIRDIKLDGQRSNIFYYILNWIYQSGFEYPAVYGVILKLTNALFFLFTYLIITWKSTEKIGPMDLLILFHPWLLYAVIRNVRDLYIIFLLAVLLYIVFKKRTKTIDFVVCIIAVISMSFIRSFLIVPMVAILIIKAWELSSARKKNYIVAISAMLILIAGYQYKDEILVTSVNVFLGNSVYFGGENQDDTGKLMQEVIESGGIGADLKSLIIKKVIFAVPVFLFTPHPYNWAQSYYEQRLDGMYIIYTDADNILIILGAVLNYLFIFPMTFKYVYCWRQVNAKHVVIPLFIMAFYSIFLLGNADMRIRYTYIIFLIFGFYRSGLTLYESRSDIKYLFLSLFVFSAILFVSS